MEGFVQNLPARHGGPTEDERIAGAAIFVNEAF
jgi:hypothetical protein